jgi:hypothetical protein
MKLTGKLFNLPIDLKINNVPVYHNDFQIGKITHSFVYKNELRVIIKIDKKKLKKVKNLLQILLDLK